MNYAHAAFKFFGELYSLQFFQRNFMHQKIDYIFLCSGDIGTLSIYERCQHLFKSKIVPILTYTAIESYSYIAFLIKCI